MPPKQSKPQVPMETRSRAKAKKNAESQHPVDAKRSRTDSRPSFKLTQNQRVNPEEVEFVETLQKLGDGQMQDGDEGHFEFPTECLTDNVINDVYGTALATQNYDALHERVILTPLNKDANDICDEEMLSLLNKRALSSSLAGFAELAVGTAWTSLLGKFASPELLLLSPLDDANAPAHFLAFYVNPINCRKHKASLHALFPGSSLDNSTLALQHLLLWLLRLNSV
ncbi:PIF1-like helicase domain-containing protein [Ditylenchus destructor]|uniref:PIF1-like helicase domain-containing protein n=1 Tax=Ditylenchus destructor TaxID=166010 RepID=A0AAD4QSI4_9BILA|nr:PIF1-like helicase domain-containing protein [Ditylenchus destructor]